MLPQHTTGQPSSRLQGLQSSRNSALLAGDQSKLAEVCARGGLFFFLAEINLVVCGGVYIYIYIYIYIYAWMPCASGLDFDSFESVREDTFDDDEPSLKCVKLQHQSEA